MGVGVVLRICASPVPNPHKYGGNTVFSSSPCRNIERLLPVLFLVEFGVAKCVIHAARHQLVGCVGHHFTHLVTVALS